MNRQRKFSGICLLVLILTISPTQAQATWVQPKTVTGGYGVQVKSWLLNPDEVAEIKETGFSFVRTSFGWQSMESAKNVYNWQESDDFVRLIRPSGLKMVIALNGGNPVYDGEVVAPPRNVDHVFVRPRAPFSPESVQAFARYAANMAVRYDGPDVVWEVWNEPDLARFWPPKPDAQAFSVLADVTCRVIKSVRPSAVVIGPALGRIPDKRDGVDEVFIGNVLSSGAAQCFDALSVHPYRHGAEEPEAAYGDYATMTGLMARHQFYKPLVNTEWGYTTTQVSKEKQADYLMRARLVDMIWGVPLSIVYEWKDSRDDKDDPEGNFGIKTWKGADKEALTAMKRWLPRLADMRLLKQIHTKNPRDIILLLENDQGMRTVVAWSLKAVDERPTRVLVGNDMNQQGMSLKVEPQLIEIGHSFTDDSVKVEEE